MKSWGVLGSMPFAMEWANPCNKMPGVKSPYLRHHVGQKDPFAVSKHAGGYDYEFLRAKCKCGWRTGRLDYLYMAKELLERHLDKNVSGRTNQVDKRKTGRIK